MDGFNFTQEEWDAIPYREDLEFSPIEDQWYRTRNRADRHAILQFHITNGKWDWWAFSVRIKEEGNG